MSRTLLLCCRILPAVMCVFGSNDLSVAVQIDFTTSDLYWLSSTPYIEDGFQFVDTSHDTSHVADWGWGDGGALALGDWGHSQSQITVQQVSGLPFTLTSLDYLFSSCNAYGGTSSLEFRSSRGGIRTLVALSGEWMDVGVLDFSADQQWQAISSFTITGLPSPSTYLSEAAFDNLEVQPVQPVYLAWDQDIPILIDRAVDKNGKVRYLERSGSMAHATVSPGDQTDIAERMLRMFTDSGVTGVTLTDSPEGATVVYFAEKPGDPSWNLLGMAYSGVDRFNRSREGAVAVFIQGEAEDDAEVASHEVGHTLGLRHVDPGSADDPGNLEVMDYDSTAGDRERFIDAVTKTWDPDGVTHNPVYHLKRYVDGIPADDLSALGCQAGTWDQTWWERLIATITGSASDRTLYDVYVRSGCSEDTMATIGHFDQVSLRELGTMAFTLDGGTYLELIGASEPQGVLDTVLAAGDPYLEGATLISPSAGTGQLFLQTYTDPLQHSFETFSDVMLTVVVVPEPSSLLVLISGICWIVLRRSVGYNGKKRRALPGFKRVAVTGRGRRVPLDEEA